MAYNQKQYQQQQQPYGFGGPQAGPGYPQAGPGYPQQGGYPPPGPGYPQQQGYAPQPGFMIPGQGQPYEQYEEPKNDDVGGGYANDISGFEFNDKTIRAAFIRKVYSILMMQLAVTLAFISLFFWSENLKSFSQKNPGLLIGALILTFVLVLAMACCENLRRKAPHNFICLGIFTLAEGFLLGVVSSTYTADSVLLAVGLTAVICLGLTLFAFQTKWDFTGMGTYLFVILLVFILFGIIAMFFPSIPIVRKVYAGIGALIFSLYLVYDTQLMLGGKHKYALSPEEYIFASLNLYLDIVNLFLYLLALFGDRN